MRVPQPIATQHSPAKGSAIYFDEIFSNAGIMNLTSSSTPAGPSVKRPSRKAKLPKDITERAKAPAMDSASGFTHSDDDSVSSLPSLIPGEPPSCKFTPISYKSVFAKGGILNDKMERVDKAIHIAGLEDPVRDFDFLQDFDNPLDRYLAFYNSLCEEEYDRHRRGDTKGACDSSKSNEKPGSCKEHDGASIKKGTFSTKKKWSTVKLDPSVTVDLPVTHAEESATTAPSTNTNVPPKSKLTPFDGNGVVISGLPDHVLATADHVPLDTDSNSYSRRQYPTRTMQELCEMSEPVPFDEFRRRASAFQFLGDRDENEGTWDGYDRPMCVGGWNGCGVGLNCTCMDAGVTTKHDFTGGDPKPAHSNMDPQTFCGTDYGLTKFQESRKIDCFLKFINDGLTWKEASLFLRMCGANVRVAVIMYHNFSGLESVRRVLTACSSLPVDEEGVEGSKLRDYVSIENQFATSPAKDNLETIPGFETVSSTRTIDDSRPGAFKSQEPTFPASSAYTVTYWATVNSGDKSVLIPIDSDNVTGTEKSIIESNTGMKKVWKWVHEKGLTGKVDLQDAFDLAQGMQGGEEPVQVPDNDDRSYVKDKSEVGSK
ncbi:hypothetical protein HRS9139_07177 [Pyrenophora teres f. teres]|nr:hypothetical protein HRS9139_07177 [Pyrenophora teres f. teres]KAE8829619.1 hypothetical protein HRS9122_09434 [Pyrenophora teres f. teres]